MMKDLTRPSPGNEEMYPFDVTPQVQEQEGQGYQKQAQCHRCGCGASSHGVHESVTCLNCEASAIFLEYLMGRKVKFADDGVRLSVDGELLVDQWHDGSAEYHAPVTYLNTGNHDVVVEYYENSGEAEIRLWWE